MDLSTPLRRLKVFCTIVDEGGVTRAADLLSVSQPAVSAQVKALEEGCGAPLFLRSGHGLELTESGKLVYDWSRRVLAERGQLRDDIRQLATGEAGRLTVHSSMAIGTYLLPPMLSRLRASRPKASITVHVSEPHLALEAARLGTADFSVCSMVAPQVDHGIVSEHLWNEPIVLVTGPNSAIEATRVDAADLRELPIVGVPQDVAYERIIERQLAQAGIAPLTPVIRLGHAEAIKQAVIDNNWVTLAPWYVVRDDVLSGRLRTHEVVGANLEEEVGLHFRENKHFSPLQQAALDQLRSLARTRSKTDQ